MTWMIMANPKVLCRKHLLGEHNEIHKAHGSLKRGKRITRYVQNNCLEPLAMIDRHDRLVEEMKRRGYNHHSPLTEPPRIDHLPREEAYARVDILDSIHKLINRCPVCKARNIMISNGEDFDQVADERDLNKVS